MLLPKHKKKLTKNTKEHHNSLMFPVEDLPVPEESKTFRGDEPFFLPYQRYTWQAIDKHQAIVVEKSRRIGISWLLAGWAAMKAASNSGNDVFYLSYNYQMTEGFISDAAWFCKAYNLAATQFDTRVISDGDRSILTFRIRFTSGFKIVALSSRPSNLRSRKGDLILDESAFMDDLEAVLKSALATLIWGFKVVINSTHNGKENPFNKLCERIRKKELDYKLIKITFRQAIADGLCRRVFQVSKQKWSITAQNDWVKSIYNLYGVGSSEELDCEPLDIKGGGKFFRREWFEIITSDELPIYFDTIVRAWDLAATDRTVNDAAFYTAGVLLGKFNETYIILDVEAQQLSTSSGDDLLIQIAEQDNAIWGDRLAYSSVAVRWEEEGGSSGKRVTEYLKARLTKFNADGIKPTGSKVVRAKPIASEAMRGNVKMLAGKWNDVARDALHGFDGTPKPLVNDITDALSLAYNALDACRINPMLFT
ncbi:MAG: hypothetical protein KME30_32190 [Iphinoe sp. HA4291-MV1]|jgi:predicted phage terminase large subunit-like protein|nr:hypothetical protein [Iphinoe sp. HA4291-MV1]